MDIICKPSYNVIFWRKSENEDWQYENLDTVVEAYIDIPYTELDYVAPVRRENTDEILYHIFKCRECDKTILTVDANHEYEFCPHCGRAIWRQEMEALQINWDCYWAWEGEKEVDGEYFPETFCRFGYPLCTPCKICKYYVRRDKIDDYIHYLLDEIEILTKLP